MDVYLNFHRPCGYARDVIDERGKIIKKYDVYMTPFEKLKTIENVGQYLRPDVTIKMLEEIAAKESDNECAERMQNAKRKLFETFRTC